MKQFSFYSLIICLSFCFISQSYAQGVSDYLPYQGFLMDTNGEAVNGVVNLTIRVYRTENEDQANAVTTVNQQANVQNGAFGIYLGNVRNYFTSGEGQWIGISVDNQPEMLPRQRFGSIPYAFLSYNAQRFDGRPSTDFVTQDQVVNFVTQDQINNVQGGLDTDAVNALIDARNYLDTDAITVLVNTLIDARNYLNTDAVNALIDARNYLDANGVNALIDARNYLDANGVNALIDARNYLNAAGVNALIDARNYVNENQVNTLIDNRNYLTEAQITAIAAAAAANALQQVQNLQGQIDNLQDQIDNLQNNNNNNGQGNNPTVLGVSNTSSNGRFSFNGATGLRAAHLMCETSYPNEANAHFCTVSELVSAVSRNQVLSGEGFDTWTYSASEYTRAGGSNFNNCHSLLYNSADIANGTVGRIDKNVAAGGNGGNVAGDILNIVPNQACNRNLRVLCCK